VFRVVRYAERGCGRTPPDAMDGPRAGASPRPANADAGIPGVRSRWGHAVRVSGEPRRAGRPEGSLRRTIGEEGASLRLAPGGGSGAWGRALRKGVEVRRRVARDGGDIERDDPRRVEVRGPDRCAL